MLEDQRWRNGMAAHGRASTGATSVGGVVEGGGRGSGQGGRP
jgi:hypothetical protein